MDKNTKLKAGDEIIYYGTKFTLVTDLGKKGWEVRGNDLIWTFGSKHIAQAELAKTSEERTKKKPYYRIPT